MEHIIGTKGLELSPKERRAMISYNIIMAETDLGFRAVVSCGEPCLERFREHHRLLPRPGLVSALWRHLGTFLSSEAQVRFDEGCEEDEDNV